MKMGILGTSDIAFRRFLPALCKSKWFTYAGVATRTHEKGRPFVKTFGGGIYDGYEALLSDKDIEAVYVPLPPALHFEWGRKVLEAGKHLLMEKPFTTTLAETEELLRIAAESGLAVHENYMFLYHSQLSQIKRMAEEWVGKIRLIRISFGFPKHEKGDFRYNKELGGGALLDCGGYPVRLAWELLGENAHLVQAKLSSENGYEVDLFGSAVLENDGNICAQISFGMDNAYQCQLEIWGSEATLIAPRIFTAGSEFAPKIILRSSQKEQTIHLQADDQFLHSLEGFSASCNDRYACEKSREAIRKQAELVDELFHLSCNV